MSETSLTLATEVSIPAHVHRSRRVMAISFGFSFALVLAVVLCFAFMEGTACATAYTATLSPGNWDNPATWFPSGVPGSGTGDTVSITSAVTFPSGFSTANPIAAITINGPLIMAPGAGTLALGGSGSIITPGTLTINGGTISIPISNALTYNSTTPLNWTAGTITGSGNFNINAGTVNWSGGTFGGGSMNLAIPVTTNVTGPITISGNAVVSNHGTWTWNTTATTTLSNGHLDNYGTFDIQNDATLTGDPTSTFQNISGSPTATLRKSAGTGITNFSGGLRFLADGGTNFNVQTGSVVMNVDTNSAEYGNMTVALGSTLDFAGGTWDDSFSSATMSGAGNFNVSGATINFGGTYSGTGALLISAGAFNVNTATPTTIPALSLTGGTLGGSGAVTVTTLTWSGGSMTGAGSTTVTGTTTMNNAANAILDTRTFNNGGTLTLTPGSFSFFMNNGAIFNNGSTGTFNVAGDGALVPSAGTATFNNAGVFARTGGSGNFTLAPGTFNNQNTGTLRAGPGILILGSTVNDSGVFDLSGVLWIASGTTFVNAGATFTGVAALNLFGGTLTINAAVTIPILAFSSGTLNGPGALTINNMGWGTGTMSGTGSTTISGNANIQPMGAVTLDQRALNVAPTAVVIYYANFNPFTLSNGATINNAGAIGADTALTTTMSASGTGNAINNTGSFDATGGSGTLTIPAGIAFTNTGAAAVLRARDGGLTIQGPFTNSAGQIEIWNNSTLTLASPLALGGGSLKGNGTVVSSTVTNDGTVDPGLSPGILNITGDYVQTAAGVLNIELAGTTVGTGYDQLNVSGNVTLAGTLNVNPLAFTPPGGSTYTILTFASRVPAATDFTTKNLNGAAATLTPGYTPTALVLAAGVAQQTDLSITKTAPATAFHNQNISYTIVVTNNGPDPATGVTMTDTLPAQMAFVSASPTVGSCSGTTTVTCTIGSLANAASATITIVANANTPGSLTNTASVTGAEGDPNATNNNVAAATLVTPSTDLGIAKSAPASVPAGGSLTYTLTASNAGPDPAATLQVVDLLPGGVTLVSATGTSWTCATSGSTVTCNFVGTPPPPLSPIPPITIVVTAPATAGSITNTASIGPNTDDPILSNNTATAMTTVTGSADLSIAKTGPPTVAAGGNVTYTIDVTNNGPSGVTNVQVNDSPGPGLTFVSSTAPCSGGFPCTITTLAPSQTISFTSTWSVSSSATGTITNNVTVFGPGVTDPIAGNNTSTRTASVAIDSDVSITKAGPAPVAPGATVAYTITVTNLGPSDATGVVVSDPTPAGTTFVSTSCGPSFPCTIGSLPVGGTVTITSTYSVNATATGSITNTASVASASTDGNSANNSATTSTTVVPKANLAITKTGPSALPGGTIVFTITIRNFGPSDATAITVNDSPSSGLTFASNAGACTGAFPCAIASLVAGASTTITSTFNVSGSVTSVTNTATVTSSTLDPNPANNSSSVTVGGPVCLTGVPVIFIPFDGQTDVGVSGTLQWSNVGASSYDVYLGPAGTGCDTLVATVNGPASNYSGLNANTVYEAKVIARKPSCPSISSACIRFTTGKGPCNLAAPQLQQPQNGSSAGSPVLLQWSNVGADSYRVVVTVSGVDVVDQTTPNTSLTATVPNGTATWRVIATQGNCTATSATGTFNVCAPPAAPIAGVVGATTTNRTYSVLVVNASPDTTQYEFQESDNEAFLNVQTTTTTSTSVDYIHDVKTAALVFFYRVRAFTACTSTPGDYSRTIRVVILPNLVNLRRPAVNVPAGSRTLVVQEVFIPGDTDRVAFTAIADRPWIVNIDPASGILPPEGITLDVTLDPAQLPNGTFTATVIVTTSPLGAPNGRPIETHASNKKSAPVTINLVTPVIPADPDKPASDSVFIPAVGHLAGLNSQWRSDVRIYNPAPVALKYLINFTPNGSTEVKRTTIETAANATTALDDIIHNWYGVGEVGDSATGVLEVRPLAPEVAPAFSLQPVVASRTFNAGVEGTVGQFIPGVPFTKFIGNGLRQSMQQIAQSAAYRTNFAVVEGSGSPASVVLSMFNSAGNKLFDLPVNLGAGEQKLLNGLLTAQGVSVADGRMEVRVSGGDGKVTAYASVVDNASLDPQFIPGATLDAAGSRLYVVPGVADLNNGLATWRTDIRVFNSGSTPQSATMTFYPEGNSASPLAASMTVLPNEVKVLDNVLQTVFATHDAGGAVQITTATDSQFVVTGRTFNQTSTGSLGQFIRAATAADGVGRNTRTLNILQVEDSVRFRTNIGLAEMSGKAVRVEVSVTLPDSKVTPIIEVALGADEFRQFSVSQFGLGNIYNARVSLRVIDGDGTVTAYGSLIDQVTTDPTYVAAQ